MTELLSMGLSALEPIAPIGLQILGARGDDVGVPGAAPTSQQMDPDRPLISGGNGPATGRGGN